MFQNMTNQELVEQYNKLTGKAIKRFATRAAGERQLLAAIEKRRAVSIKRSWQQEKIAKARKERTNVEVFGEHNKSLGKFRSVRGAFVALGLPLGRHVRFRGMFKDNDDKAVFEHNGKSYKFVGVDAYKPSSKKAA